MNLQNPRVERKSVVEGENYPRPKGVQKVIEEIPKVRDKAIVATTFDLGARRGEIVALNKRDYRPPVMVVSRKEDSGKTRETTARAQ